MMKSDIIDMIDRLIQAAQGVTQVIEDLGHLADEHTDHILKEKLDHQAAEHAQRCDRYNQLMDQLEERFTDFVMMACGIGADAAKEALEEIKKGRFPGDIIREGQAEGKLIVRLPDGSVQENVPDKMWSPTPRPSWKPDPREFPLILDVKVDPENQEHRDYVTDLIRGHLPDGNLVVRCDLDPDTDDLSFIWRIEWSFQKNQGVALEVGHKEGTLVKDLPGIALGLARTLKAKRKRAYGGQNDQGQE